MGPTFPERCRDAEGLPGDQRCSELEDLPGTSLALQFEKPHPADSATKYMEMTSPFRPCQKLAGPLGSASEASWSPPSIHSPQKGQQQSRDPALGTGKSASIWLRYRPKLAAALSPFEYFKMFWGKRLGCWKEGGGGMRENHFCAFKTCPFLF